MRQEYSQVPDFEVSFRVPAGRQVKAVRLIRVNQDAPFKIVNDYAVPTIPKLHIAVAVHLALA